MINAVNAKTGKPHVTSDDVRNLNAALVGKENYVSTLYRALSAEMIDSNTLRIYEGSGFFNGCFFRVEGYEDATISTGSVGYNRMDVVALKYTNENDVEGITVVTFAGTKTTGTPTAPTVPDTSILDGASIAYMPLYKVTLNGINIASVMSVFSKLSNLPDTMNTLNRKISDMEPAVTESSFDSGWRTDFDYTSNFDTYSTASDSVAKFRRYGKVVEIRGKMKNIEAFTPGTTYHSMASLPTGFRPSSEIIYVQQGSNANKFIIRISADGSVSISRYGTTDTNAVANAGTWINICHSYLVD